MTEQQQPWGAPVPPPPPGYGQPGYQYAGPNVMSDADQRLWATLTHLSGLAVYAGCLSGLFGVSALYHRGNWGPAASPAA